MGECVAWKGMGGMERDGTHIIANLTIQALGPHVHSIQQCLSFRHVEPVDELILSVALDAWHDLRNATLDVFGRQSEGLVLKGVEL